MFIKGAAVNAITSTIHHLYLLAADSNAAMVLTITTDYRILLIKYSQSQQSIHPYSTLLEHISWNQINLESILINLHFLSQLNNHIPDEILSTKLHKHITHSEIQCLIVGY